MVRLRLSGRPWARVCGCPKRSNHASGVVAPGGGLSDVRLLVPRADARGYFLSSPAGIQEVSRTLLSLCLRLAGPASSCRAPRVAGLVFLSPHRGGTLFASGVSPWTAPDINRPPAPAGGDTLFLSGGDRLLILRHAKGAVPSPPPVAGRDLTRCSGMGPAHAIET
jgi:hypothetical protein